MGALANLTTVSPDKYCQLVEEEGGLALVEEIVNNNSGEEESEPNQDQVKSLALKVRNNVVGWKETETTGLQFDGRTLLELVQLELDQLDHFPLHSTPLH